MMKKGNLYEMRSGQWEIAPKEWIENGVMLWDVIRKWMLMILFWNWMTCVLLLRILWICYMMSWGLEYWVMLMINEWFELF